MKSIIFWDVMLCSPLSFNRRFGGTYRLHINQISSWRISACHLLGFLWEGNLYLRPWRWRRYVPPKRRLKLNGLHDVTSQKIILFITVFVCTFSISESALLFLVYIVTWSSERQLLLGNGWVNTFTWHQIHTQQWSCWKLFSLCSPWQGYITDKVNNIGMICFAKPGLTEDLYIHKRQIHPLVREEVTQGLRK
jgi:hypothetical protein